MVNVFLYATITVGNFAAADTGLGSHRNLEGAIQPEPSYVSGRPVLYFSVSKYTLAEIGATLAYSLYNADGYPVIFYDEASLAKLPKEFQRWVFSHELAHFKLGHFEAQNTLYQKSLGFKGSQFSYEQAADCEAVKALKNAHSLTRAEVIVIANTAQMKFKDSPLQRTSRTSPSNYSHQFRYLESEERAENIIACY